MTITNCNSLPAVK